MECSFLYIFVSYQIAKLTVFHKFYINSPTQGLSLGYLWIYFIFVSRTAEQYASHGFKLEFKLKLKSAKQTNSIITIGTKHMYKHVDLL